MAEKKDEMDGEKLEALFEEASKEGAILAVLHFDAHGPDEEKVKSLLVEFMGKLTKEKGVLYCRAEIEKAISSDNVYSSFSEVKIMTENFQHLLNAVLKYSPIAVEILKPKKIVLTLSEAQASLLDASQMAQDFSNYVLQNVMKKDQIERFDEHMKRRAEFGKTLLGKAQSKEEKK
ncbi:MAG: hypothetical protein ACE5DI_02545 [Candidatus Micrarchaeia archaeon]